MFDARPWYDFIQPCVVVEPFDGNFGRCLGWRSKRRFGYGEVDACHSRWSTVRRLCSCEKKIDLIDVQFIWFDKIFVFYSCCIYIIQKISIGLLINLISDYCLSDSSWQENFPKSNQNERTEQNKLKFKTIRAYCILPSTKFERKMVRWWKFLTLLCPYYFKIFIELIFFVRFPKYSLFDF